jgi:predicted DNA-binding WGR domain protein
MISNEILGRYEYCESGSNKYWWIVHDKTNGNFIAKWGRIGTVHGTKIYSLSEAMKKISEKRAKGYTKKEGYKESIGENSVHFIKNFFAEESEAA